MKALCAISLILLLAGCGDDPVVPPPAADGGSNDLGPTADGSPDADTGEDPPDGGPADFGGTDGPSLDGTASDFGPGLPGVLPRFSDTVSFLYGPGGAQTGVAPGAIDPARVAVLRGKVIDVDEAPIAGVIVTILGSPQLGRTETDARGEFSLVTNGGARQVLDFQKAGYLPVQRGLKSAWESYEVLADEVVLTALDAQATMVAFGSSGMQVHQGGMVNDGDGMRRASVLVPDGVTASMRMPDGSSLPLAMGMIRATEYTVGANGPRAMPGELPPLSGYTYAVDISIDEAIAAGAESVELSAPLITYVDNFIGFPIGTGVPLGSYDRARGVWTPSPDGVVLDILGQVGGLATIDGDGDGLADDATALAALGIKGAEGSGVGPLDIANMVNKTPIETNAIKAKGAEIQIKGVAKACAQSSW